MDNLSATALAASRAGMSYGKYVALHGIRYFNKPIVADVPTKVCHECGKEFSMVGRNGNSLYCNSDCQKMHSNKMAVQRYHERKKAKEKNNV